MKIRSPLDTKFQVYTTINNFDDSKRRKKRKQKYRKNTNKNTGKHKLFYLLLISFYFQGAECNLNDN